MTAPTNTENTITVRLAQTLEEIEEAQRLRYKVFYKEQGAKPCLEVKNQEKDFDSFDGHTDHLVVLNEDKVIVGTYRLLRQKTAEKIGRFYSDDEYNLTNLIKSGQSLLELGRSCVLAEYRTQPVLNTLWQGIADYITDHKIDILFGCASFQGTDVKAIAKQLSYLHHFHATDKSISPVAIESRYVNMNIVEKSTIDERRTFVSLPPLIKGYLRLGATIGEGAVIDEQFNTIDVCIVVQTSLMTERYRRHYERKIKKTMPGQVV